MSSWVLCGKSIVNNSDKNLVDGQESSTFNVPEELLSLESRVLNVYGDHVIFPGMCGK